jgi:hypothetical protein
MEPEASIILLDVPEGAGEIDRDFLERFGHPVRVCHGPHQSELCPLLRTGECEMVNSAHGIVFELDLDRPQHRAILERYQKVVRPDVPIRAVVRPDQAEKYAALLEGVEVWTHDPNVSELDAFAAEVDSATRFGEA